MLKINSRITPGLLYRLRTLAELTNVMSELGEYYVLTIDDYVVEVKTETRSFCQIRVTIGKDQLYFRVEADTVKLNAFDTFTFGRLLEVEAKLLELSARKIQR